MTGTTARPLAVGDIHITDPAAYQAHISPALATIARFGGRVIAGGGSRVDLLEGDPSPEWIFIIEFPTADAARRWYQSEDYQEALRGRRSASHGRVFLIEGTQISTALPVAGLDPGEGLKLFRGLRSPPAYAIAGPWSSGSRSASAGGPGAAARVFQRLPVGAAYTGAMRRTLFLQRTRFESTAERKPCRRQLTDDSNVEISGRDLRGWAQVRLVKEPASF